MRICLVRQDKYSSANRYLPAGKLRRSGRPGLIRWAATTREFAKLFNIHNALHVQNKRPAVNNMGVHNYLNPAARSLGEMGTIFALLNCVGSMKSTGVMAFGTSSTLSCVFLRDETTEGHVRCVGRVQTSFSGISCSLHYGLCDWISCQFQSKAGFCSTGCLRVLSAV